MSSRLRLVPQAPKTTSDTPAIDVLARTLYGEARGENVRGMEAVAAVVMNRVARGGWWGRTVETVCLKPWQFSCWNANDPNRQRVLEVTDADPAFRSCLRIARRAVAGALEDPTKGATHYHAIGMLPRWAEGHQPSARIGNHVFYNDVE